MRSIRTLSNSRRVLYPVCPEALAMSEPRPRRHRIQAMVEKDVMERVEAEAAKNGVSISAIAAILIKRGLDASRQ